VTQASLFADGAITYDSKALEAHYTPDWLAEYVVDLIPRRPNIRKGPWLVVEPHGGGGAFLRALAHRSDIAGRSMDIDPNCWAVREGGAFVGDFLSSDSLAFRESDVVIGNPPFSNAEEHIDRALMLAPVVVFVLPVSRLETEARATFYGSRPLESIVFLPERVWAGSRHVGIFRFERGHVGPWRGILEPNARCVS
jgi:hypothetical protein